MGRAYASNITYQLNYLTILKNRQHHGKNKKYKRTNNDLQNMRIKLKIE